MVRRKFVALVIGRKKWRSRRNKRKGEGEMGGPRKAEALPKMKTRGP
jgi:hypothetical protein